MIVKFFNKDQELKEDKKPYKILKDEWRITIHIKDHKVNLIAFTNENIYPFRDGFIAIREEEEDPSEEFDIIKSEFIRLENIQKQWIKRMDDNMHGLIRDYNEMIERSEKLEQSEQEQNTRISNIENMADKHPTRLIAKVKKLEQEFIHERIKEIKKKE